MTFRVTTLSIPTLSIMTLSIVTLSIATLSITTLSITTHCLLGLIVVIGLKMHTLQLVSHFFLCWMSLCCLPFWGLSLRRWIKTRKIIFFRCFLVERSQKKSKEFKYFSVVAKNKQKLTWSVDNFFWQFFLTFKSCFCCKLMFKYFVFVQMTFNLFYA